MKYNDDQQGVQANTPTRDKECEQMTTDKRAMQDVASSTTEGDSLSLLSHFGLWFTGLWTNYN